MSDFQKAFEATINKILSTGAKQVKKVYCKGCVLCGHPLPGCQTAARTLELERIRMSFSRRNCKKCFVCPHPLPGCKNQIEAEVIA